jgi:hypothetical protein
LERSGFRPQLPLNRPLSIGYDECRSGIAVAERFTLLSELGRGGMGVVWKARDEETGQVVALKLLREAYADDPDYVARFERELELAKRIHSDHVVQVLGFGVRKKVPYLALEYVDGPSLHDAQAQHGAYTWPEARALLVQIAQGLADAHTAGVIHRDVKPSNVLIGADGVAKLTDFGIARGLDLTRMTATSTMLGTPAYLAPEGPVDTRSDLYSLGIIGFELLAGSPPFVGSTFQQIILAHVRTPPDLEKLPPEARPVLGWLLAKGAEDRPQNAQELLAVLRGRLMLAGMAVPGASHGTPRPTAPTAPKQAPPPVRPAPAARPRAAPSVRTASSPRPVVWRPREFVKAGRMKERRAWHAATLLSDGAVLISGGRNAWDRDQVCWAEIFDPATGDVFRVCKLIEPRSDHTATLLSDGRVLVLGGAGSDSSLASAEVYDPKLGAFAPAGRMRFSREAHTATPLLDGRVLIVGGYDSTLEESLSAIEIFDPKTSRFSMAGGLAISRWDHAATLLADGRVLISGGSTMGDIAEQSELYDPETDSVAYGGRLTDPRRGHATTLLPDGRVLIAGGIREPHGDGDRTRPLSSAEVYIPDTGRFVAANPMKAPRYGHTATMLPEGLVLITGGFGSTGAVATTELFDPASGSFAPGASMSVAREGHTATLLDDGRVLISGGNDARDTTSALLELYA